MNDTPRCPQCSAELPPDAPAGLCPKCLVAAGLESESPSPSEFEVTAPSPGSAAFVPPSVERLAALFPQLEVLELLGRGGMGAVYKARQRGLERLVAVKILPPEVGRDPAFAQRFAREARALAHLNHPHIVAVHDFGQAGGLFYFVMEFVDGLNLRQTMQAGGLTPQEALAIVPQICDALQYAHDEGIVHRDIKPENILLDTRGRVKIADFGLSKLTSPTASGGRESPAYEHSLTGTHQVMGTLRYMAPEQMHGTKTVDHRADIYSLGVVFYELLTGEVPMGRFDPPSKKVHVDVRLDEVVLRALEQEPDKRYQRASEVKTDVETLASKPAAIMSKKPDEERAPTDEVDLEKARQEVKVPAIGLMVVGILMCLMAVVPTCVGGGLFFRQWGGDYGAPMELEKSQSAREWVEDSGPPLAEPPSQPDEPTPEPPAEPIDNDSPKESTTPDEEPMGCVSPGASPAAIFFASAATGGEYAEPPARAGLNFLAIVLLIAAVFLLIMPLILGVITTIAGWRMLHLQSHGLAVTASILVLLPCQPVAILGMVFGIWSLIVLNRSHIKAAFAQTLRQPRAADDGPSRNMKSWWLSRSPGTRRTVKVLLGLLVLGLAIIFLSFRVHGSGNMVHDEIAGTEVSVFEVGAFDPWYRRESYQGPKEDESGYIRRSSSQVRYLSWSMLAGVLAAVLLSALVGIEKVDRAAGARRDGNPSAGSASWQGTPITQFRFAVGDDRVVVPKAIFHFSALGYELIEQRPDACTFQRGYKWGGFWETDIRRLHTRLTVRTAPAASGETWVSCDWSVRTLGSWITRRDMAKLEAEGHELETLLQGSGRTLSETGPDSIRKEAPSEFHRSKIHGPAAQRGSSSKLLALAYIAASVILIGACVVLAITLLGHEPVGTVLIYDVVADDSPDAPPVDLDAIVRAVDERINTGFSNVASLQGNNDGPQPFIEISIYGQEPEVRGSITRRMAMLGTLQLQALAHRLADAEIVMLAESGTGNEVARPAAGDQPATVVARWVPVAAGRSKIPLLPLEDENVVQRKLPDGETQVLVLVGPTDVHQGQLSSVKVIADDTGYPALSASFTSQGAERMKALTTEYLSRDDRPRYLAIVIDGRLVSAPKIMAPVSNQAQLTGRFTDDEAADLAAVLQAGSLPAKLVLKSSKSLMAAASQDREGTGGVPSNWSCLGQGSDILAARKGDEFLYQMMCGNLDYCFNLLSQAERDRLGIDHPRYISDWKAEVEKLPGYRQLRRQERNGSPSRTDSYEEANDGSSVAHRLDLQWPGRDGLEPLIVDIRMVRENGAWRVDDFALDGERVPPVVKAP